MRSSVKTTKTGQRRQAARRRTPDDCEHAKTLRTRCDAEQLEAPRHAVRTGRIRLHQPSATSVLPSLKLGCGRRITRVALAHCVTARDKVDTPLAVIRRRQTATGQPAPGLIDGHPEALRLPCPEHSAGGAVWQRHAST